MPQPDDRPMPMLSRTIRVLWTLMLALLAAGSARAQESEPWKVKQGDVIDMSACKFFLPESKSVELKQWEGKPVMLVYVMSFDKHCEAFLRTFQEKTWPRVRNLDMIFYVVGYGEQIPSMSSWLRETGVSLPFASDQNRKLHASISNLTSVFPQIFVMDRDHRMCAAVTGDIDPSDEKFIQMVEDVVNVGYQPPAAP